MKAHRIGPGFALRCAFVLIPGLGVAEPAAAQPWGRVSVLPVQDLTFGVLPTGMATHVDPLDAARRAEIEIRGKGTFLVQIGLPPALIHAAGHAIPLSYSSTDAVIEPIRHGGPWSTDPSTPFVVDIHPRQGGVLLYLGSTALPASAQAPGSYSASITILVSNTGT